MSAADGFRAGEIVAYDHDRERGVIYETATKAMFPASGIYFAGGPISLHVGMNVEFRTMPHAGDERVVAFRPPSVERR